MPDWCMRLISHWFGSKLHHTQPSVSCNVAWTPASVVQPHTPTNHIVLSYCLCLSYEHRTKSTLLGNTNMCWPCCLSEVLLLVFLKHARWMCRMHFLRMKQTEPVIANTPSTTMMPIQNGSSNSLTPMLLFWGVVLIWLAQLAPVASSKRWTPSVM